MSSRLSLLAAVRKRWGASRVAIDDPISAARGAFKGRLASSGDLRKAARDDDAAAASRRR
jgi:hypothetical protein